MVFKERRLAAAGTVARAPADDRELHAAFLAAQETASTQTEDGRGPADSSQPVGISEGAASDPRGAMFAVDEDVDRKSRRYSIEMGTADSAENVPPRDAPACLSPGLAAKGAGLSAVRHAVANVERDAASASAPTGRSSMRASQADLEECSCGSAASNVPARVLAARSSDVMVVEWDGDESETSDVEAEVTKATDGREEEPAETKEEPAEAKEDDNENELMSQLLGLWRKLRIENAELRAQVQETSMAVEEANSQLGVARSSPRNQLPLSPRSLIGSSGSGASTPDGGGSPMGSKAKRGREVAGSSLLRPRKLVAEPDPVPDVDTLKPEELWAMLLREREARDFYRQQMESNAKLIEQLKATHAELCRQLDDATTTTGGSHTPVNRVLRKVSRNAGPQSLMYACGHSSGSISTASCSTSPALSPRAGNGSGDDDTFQYAPTPEVQALALSQQAPMVPLPNLRRLAGAHGISRSVLGRIKAAKPTLQRQSFSSPAVVAASTNTAWTLDQEPSS